MAHIDNLVERIADPNLRAQIAEEVAKLVERKDFGLVFQRHLPEDLEVPKVLPRRGDIVRIRGEATKQAHAVLARRGETAVVVAVDPGTRSALSEEPETLDVAELVVVKDFAEPIYPGLELLDQVARGGSKPHQVILEGENYYALETLLFTHEQAVDLIYIDPPYNTGSSNWIYNDRFVAAADGYRHSKWLSFMERRLEHAKRLLKPTGFLLVSIDDAEQHRLRMLLDQVFGEQNFIATFIWKTDGNLDNQAQVKINHEYVHMYAADRSSTAVAGVRDPNLSAASKLNNDTIRNSVVKNGPKNPVSAITLKPGFPANFERGIVQARPDYFPRYSTDLVVEGGVLLNEVDAATGWANGRLLRTFIDSGYAPVIDSKGQETTFEITATGAIENVKVRREGQHHILTVLMNMGTTERSGNALREMGLTFPYPKPLELMEYLLSFGGKGAVILDFFGGSGTTAEAVMRLNAQDGGTRQVILVTNNELSEAAASALRSKGLLPGDTAWEPEGVFEKVTKPRIEAVVTGIRPDGSQHPSALNENVSFYRLTYEDENLVALHRRFDAIAAILWLRAGAAGPVVKRDADEPWSTPEGAIYGVLFDTAHASTFAAAVSTRDAVRHVYVVTDSESAFQAAVSYLPPEHRLRTTRLYSDYLHSFEINGKG